MHDDSDDGLSFGSVTERSRVGLSAGFENRKCCWIAARSSRHVLTPAVTGIGFLGWFRTMRRLHDAIEAVNLNCFAMNG